VEMFNRINAELEATKQDAEKVASEQKVEI
jgi:hypothetical protein